ncbi:hypothetical protein BDM02DRAFT_1910321 [Thelephora ganbajun]|uniref:Uncharacterized protein n=1 Tax=Thelephora ganbajun TaxID=370292 RepID=A0ACB6ZUV0_THEGA|nr:hypothetical protein BDM02DRAFT_1910321 [Thelephora ganbajun]
MSLDESKPGFLPLPPLQRGKACLNCRKRKMRCDGEKPVCGPCARRSDECEYTDRPGPTKTQVLEEHIAFLENRIRDLENPAESSSSVFLANPYAAQSQSQATYNADASLAVTHSVPAIELPTLPDRWWENEELPIQLRPILLNSFLPYVSVTGFFLNVPRFVNSFYATTTNSRPSPALLSTIYLWGLKLASVESFAAYESVFLSRAVQSVAGALGATHPHKAKHALQAELLLSNYFFWTGRFLEGRYHCGAALSIAISLGSHRTRSSQLPNPDSPTDPVEEGERINAFWSVFLNDRCWGVAMNVPSGMPDQKAPNARIDVPWPLDMAQYERVRVLIPLTSKIHI